MESARDPLPPREYHIERTPLPVVQDGSFGEELFLVPELTSDVQSVTMIGHIHRDVILETTCTFVSKGLLGAEFLFMDDNARPHRVNIVDECLQSEDITRMDCQHTHRT
ncbi:DDE_3 domain-containing protein [Trichonephila clavipes]|nr:DDE_3 domain-containing protein [Trichonephila clavipes]